MKYTHEEIFIHNILKENTVEINDELTSIWQEYNQLEFYWDHKPITEGNTAVP